MNNTETRAANARRHAEWRKKNPEKQRAIRRRADLKRKFGITPEDYDRMLASQDGLCGMCRTDTPGMGHFHFAVDHCHDTGEVRGVLCFDCNTGLGKLGDSYDSARERLDRYFGRD